MACSSLTSSARVRHRRLHISSCCLAALDVGLCCVTVNRINYSLSKAKALLYTIAVTQHRSRPVGYTTSLLWVGAIKMPAELMEVWPCATHGGGSTHAHSANRYQLPLYVIFFVSFTKVKFCICRDVNLALTGSSQIAINKCLALKAYAVSQQSYKAGLSPCSNYSFSLNFN